MPAQPRATDLTLRQAAAALGVTVGTVRQHVKAGRLGASTVVGKYGPEFRIRPAILAAFGRDRYGLELDAEELARPPQGELGQPLAEQTRELYERLLQATEEATRYRALNAAESDHFREEVARLQAERDAAKAQAEEAAAELERIRARGFFRRLRRP